MCLCHIAAIASAFIPPSLPVVLVDRSSSSLTMMHNIFAGASPEAMRDAIARAVQEAEMMASIEREVVDKDAIAHVYGVAEGRLTDELARALSVLPHECVGIVMRYEGGGTLEDLIAAAPPLSTREKISIALEVARGARRCCPLSLTHSLRHTIAIATADPFLPFACSATATSATTDHCPLPLLLEPLVILSSSSSSPCSYCSFRS